MWLLRVFATVLRITAATLVFIVAGVGIMMFNNVSIELDGMHDAVVEGLSRKMGREIYVDGEVRLMVSFFPALVVNEVRIANDKKWRDMSLVTMREASVRIALQPLFSKQIEMLELSAAQVKINLEQGKQGEKSWLPEVRPPSGNTSKAWDLDHFSFHRINLSDIQINYRDRLLGGSYSSQIDSLKISNINQNRLESEITGSFNDIPYTLSASSNLLRRFARNQAWEMQLSGNVDKHPVEMQLQYNNNESEPGGQLSLTTHQINLGRVLKKAHLAGDADFFASKVELVASLRGSDLDRIIRESDISVALSDGYLKLTNHVDKRFSNYIYKKATLTSKGSQGITADFSGKIGKEPVSFTLQTQALSDFVNGAKKARLAVSATVVKTKIELHGETALPLRSSTLNLGFMVSGEKLDEWNSLLVSDLPPVGPYKLSGIFKATPDGYQLSEFKSKINHSDLNGEIDIQMTGDRPVWKMDLVSNLFQIEDFMVEGYTLVPGKEESSAPELELDSTDNGKAIVQQADQRLGESREIDRWDIDINLESKKMLSGEDYLGAGKLFIKARENMFEQQFDLKIPAGNLTGVMQFKLADTGIEGLFKLNMEGFDYGIFLRHMDPETKADGLVSANIDLKLSGKNFSHSMEHADGTLDFVVWPENTSASVMDIWAVNLFFAILPHVNKSDSRVNCVVSILDMQDGEIGENFFAVDSTKVWLHGNLNISIPEESVDLALFPHPKKPRIFSMEVPIHIRGNFENQNLKLKGGEVAGATLSFILSPLHVPMRRIFGKKVPSDASKTCGKLLDRNHLKSIKKEINRVTAPPEPASYY